MCPTFWKLNKSTVNWTDEMSHQDNKSETERHFHKTPISSFIIVWNSIFTSKMIYWFFVNEAVNTGHGIRPNQSILISTFSEYCIRLVDCGFRGATMVIGMGKPLSISAKFLWSTRIEKFLHKFYKTITVCPISIIQSSGDIKLKFEKSIRIYSIIVIVFVLIYLSLMIILRIIFFEPLTTLKVYTVTMNIGPIFLTCFIILIETQFTHRYFTDFMFLKQKTENELITLCCYETFECEKYSFIKKHWRKLLAIQILAISLEVLIISQRGPFWRFWSGWLIMPRVFSRFRCFQHQLYTETLHLYIKLIRMKVEKCIAIIDNNEFLARQQNRQQFTMNSKQMFKDLTSSMRIFTSIYRMTYSVNRMFGFSLLIFFFEGFVQLVSNLFWIYLKLLYQDLGNISGLRVVIVFLM